MTIHVRASTLGEPTFAAAIEAIRMAPDLTADQRRYWPTSLRQMASYLGQPLETVPARITAISGKVSKLHPERLGINAKTFANHRANAKAALRWFCRLERGTARRAPMAQDYRSLWEQVEDRYAKDMLSPFLRFLTALGVRPHNVDDTHVEAYARQRQERSFTPLKRHQIRQLVRYWNRCQERIAGWPDRRLTESERARSSFPRFENFPEGLQRDLRERSAYLSKPHMTGDGRLRKPCSRPTIELERRSLEAAVRKAVSIGIPLDDLQSLSNLVRPDRAEVILDAYWKKNGEEPAIATIDLATKFCAIARFVGLAPAELERLNGMRRRLEEYRRKGLTRKNRDVVREVLNGDLWPKVVVLPERLMAEADAGRITSPITSAVLAQIAIATRILLVAPIRMGNLAQIEIGTHLIRPGGPGSRYFLVFDHYDVKNDQPLEFELDDLTTHLIDRYIYNHRPTLMRGANHDRLYPGKAHAAKPSNTFGLQITALLKKRLGIHLTPHQFRHCAAALLLERYPGNYELVRQVLGHKNIQTTMSSYVGLEMIGASRIFTNLVSGFDAPVPAPALSFGKQTGRSRG